MTETDISTAAVQRSAFVEQYDGGTLRKDGYGLFSKDGAYFRVAVPCDCGGDGCCGWQMINPGDAADLHAAVVADRDRLAAEVARLREALSYYKDTFCEGFCMEFPAGFTNREVEQDCSGCKARAALTAHAARREGEA